MNLKKSLNMATLSVLLLTGITAGQASEVDTFRNRFEPIENSLPQLNSVFNRMFTEALEEANEKAGCQQKRLYKQLRKRFRNHVFDEFNKWLYTTDDVDRIATSVRESIYQDFDVFQSPIQGGYARIIKDPTGVILNVAGKRIGNDKFEHMMGSGYKYFQSFYLEGNPLEDALKIGWRAETGMMGAFMTGVMSYADMVANFQGMRFWNHVLQKNRDILNEDLGPYVECVDEQWQQVKAVDLGHYVDDAQDESINCSLLRTPKMLRSVLKRVHQYQEEDSEGRSYTCPMFPEKLEKMKDKYQEWLPWLINGDGHKSMKHLTKSPYSSSK